VLVGHSFGCGSGMWIAPQGGKECLAVEGSRRNRRGCHPCGRSGDVAHERDLAEG
jgi:hypothetical protein